MSNLLVTVDEEIATIENRIRIDQERLKALHHLKSVFNVGSEGSRWTHLHTSTALPKPRAGSMTSKIIEHCEQVLEEGKRYKTPELLEKLQLAGISVTGKDPLATLASVLSRQKDTFKADKKQGWGLLKLMNDEGNYML